MAARRTKPTRQPKPPAVARTLEERVAHLEDRCDRIADALVPALRVWNNLRRRIPRWILSEREKPIADDSENE